VDTPLNQNKKKRGRPPSKEDAAIAMDIIKAAEKEKNESIAVQEALIEAQKAEIERREQIKKLEAIEKARIEEVQQKIKRTLRENLRKKEEEKKTKNNINFLEKSHGKLKWKSVDSGHKIQGYLENKLIFEIERKQITFNLYIKNKLLLKDKKLKEGYIGCSTSLQKLKEKSEKLI